MLKRTVVWLFGAAMVVAGLSLLLYFIAVLLWEFGGARIEELGAIVQFVDDWVSLGRLTALHSAMALGVLGVAVGSLGVLVARRQADRISVERRGAEDRLRRAHHYRDDGRVEPFIGAGTPAAMDQARRRPVA